MFFIGLCLASTFRDARSYNEKSAHEDLIVYPISSADLGLLARLVLNVA